MMDSPIIEIDGLGKKYRIGALREPYLSLRDSIARRTGHMWGVLRGKERVQHSQEDFWALKDVSFSVDRGESVGIIGRNGAGKSTLLKILSQITPPTEGRITMRGRVASLLEVGTGFHPELTGRENIYLNGAILGMTRAEIRKKFDEIVAFAEIGQFLDTPVKRFSSGMYVRLAFAVAAHLEPEILVVDEVLAVGDAEFQRKCLGKMGEVAREGRTVLFVSHNMGAISNLCPRTVLLVGGKLRTDGPSGGVISEYITLGAEGNCDVVWENPETAPGSEKVHLHAVRIVSEGVSSSNVDIQKDVMVEIEYWNLAPDTKLSVSIHLISAMGVEVLASANMHSANLDRDPWFGRPYPVGLYRTTCVFPGNFLNEGSYGINVILISSVTNIELYLRDVLSFTVHETGAMRQEYSGGWLGVVRPKLAWQTHCLDTAVCGSGPGGAE